MLTGIKTQETKQMQKGDKEKKKEEERKKIKGKLNAGKKGLRGGEDILVAYFGDSTEQCH
jgi:hypothetical protein